MPHEVTPEDLSAYLDRELDAAALAGVAGHLASCPECAALLQRLKGASAAFKKHGLEPAPEGMVFRALRARRRGGERGAPRRLGFAFAMAVIVVVVLAGGVAFKRFMPQVFEQIQGMIGKAAGSLGR
ncbi:MAG: zf-HC2 domain-containing protein [Elusimicrobia bacterium]|nr:zf-HC2 domain-containing protein [Elusimicrobiota bacterium]